MSPTSPIDVGEQKSLSANCKDELLASLSMQVSNLDERLKEELREKIDSQMQLDKASGRLKDAELENEDLQMQHTKACEQMRTAMSDRQELHERVDELQLKITRLVAQAGKVLDRQVLLGEICELKSSLESAQGDLAAKNKTLKIMLITQQSLFEKIEDHEKQVELANLRAAASETESKFHLQAVEEAQKRIESIKRQIEATEVANNVEVDLAEEKARNAKHSTKKAERRTKHARRNAYKQQRYAAEAENEVTEAQRVAHQEKSNAKQARLLIKKLKSDCVEYDHKQEFLKAELKCTQKQSDSRMADLQLTTELLRLSQGRMIKSHEETAFTNVKLQDAEAEFKRVEKEKSWLEEEFAHQKLENAQQLVKYEAEKEKNEGLSAVLSKLKIDLKKSIDESAWWKKSSDSHEAKAVQVEKEGTELFDKLHQQLAEAIKEAKDAQANVVYKETEIIDIKLLLDAYYQSMELKRYEEHLQEVAGLKEQLAKIDDMMLKEEYEALAQKFFKKCEEYQSGVVAYNNLVGKLKRHQVEIGYISTALTLVSKKALTSERLLRQSINRVVGKENQLMRAKIDLAKCRRENNHLKSKFMSLKLKWEASERKVEAWKKKSEKAKAELNTEKNKTSQAKDEVERLKAELDYETRKYNALVASVRPIRNQGPFEHVANIRTTAWVLY